MTPPTQQSDEETPSAGERLRHELFRMLTAQTEQLAHSAGEKTVNTARRFIEPAQKVKSLASDAPVPGKDLAGHVKHSVEEHVPGKDVAGHVKHSVQNHVPGMGKDKGDSSAGAGRAEGTQETGDARVTTIIEAVDVGVALSVCYNHWTDIEKFGVFTRGVREVTKSSETTSEWTFRIAFARRHHRAEIEEQVPDDRIVWRTDGAKGTANGAITFHALTPTLTRVIVVVAYHPSGLLERAGNLWRAQGRRLRLDLKNFQRYVTLAAESDPAGWRGEVRNGEVCRGHADGEQGEQGEQPENRGEESNRNGRDQS